MRERRGDEGEELSVIDAVSNGEGAVSFGFQLVSWWIHLVLMLVGMLWLARWRSIGTPRMVFWNKSRYKGVKSRALGGWRTVIECSIV